MRIYIAGKITGLIKQEYVTKFQKAEQELSAAGWEPVNPCKLGIPDDAQLHEALPICVNHLEKCQAIYLLSDWVDSPGARIELSIAMHNNMDIYYETHHSMEFMGKIKTEVL